VRKSDNFDMPDKAYTLLNLFCNVGQFLKKRMQNNDISKIINMERQDISPAV